MYLDAADAGSLIVRDPFYAAYAAGYDRGSERASPQAVCNFLNRQLRFKLLSENALKQSFFLASGAPAKAELLGLAAEEQNQADRIAECVLQLGGVPDYLRNEHCTVSVDLGDLLGELLRLKSAIIARNNLFVGLPGLFDVRTMRLIASVHATDQLQDSRLKSLLGALPQVC